MFDVVVLAGGEGKRIQKYNKKYPKPFIHYDKKPFINYVINNIAKYNINNIYILAGYKVNYLYKYYHNTFQKFVIIKCFIEKRPMETGGALFQLKNKIKNDFIVINGDTFFDIDYIKIFSKWEKFNSKNLIILKKIKKNVKLNNIILNNRKILFGKNRSLINGGVYFFKKNFLKKIKNKKLSLENYYLKNEIDKSRVDGYIDNGFFIDIGTPKDLIESKKNFLNKLKKPAAFFDRDNVLIEDKGYVHKKKDLKFKKGVIKSLKFLIKNKYYIFIVTNQAGIAKKNFRLSQFLEFQKYIKKKLLKKKIFIDDIKFCPHHPQAKIKKYKIKCNCRKPKNLMFKKIKMNWNIDLKKSFMVGDQEKDKIFAEKSQLKFIFLKKGNSLYNVIKKITK